jgi:hypothetical protein
MAIFSYPVEITMEELKNERNLDLVKWYGQNGVVPFLNEVCATVYEGGIYATGDRDIKDRIITTHIAKTENAIKRALIIQAEYMHGEGNLATSSGITVAADGQKSVVEKNELRSKTICPAAIDALKACSIPLLYAGEDM